MKTSTIAVAFAAAVGCFTETANAFSLNNAYSSIRTDVQRRAYARVMMRAHLIEKEAAASKRVPSTVPEGLENCAKAAVFDEEAKVRSDEMSTLFQLCEDQRQFELKLGKVLDTLRSDYPRILTEEPDYRIYDEQIVVRDPSGVELRGLHNYRNSISFLQKVYKFFCCHQSSRITFKMIYDWARKEIRVQWHIILVPKPFYGGYRNRAYLDGISVYEMNEASGLVTKHRFENLVVDDIPETTPASRLMAILRQFGLEGQRVPPVAVPEGVGGWYFEFNNNFLTPSHSMFFDPSIKANSALNGVVYEGDANIEIPFDEDAYNEKNRIRKRYQLAPLSREEFMDVEVQARKVRVETRQKIQVLQKQRHQERKKKEGNAFTKLFSGIFQDTCEWNWHCKRPLVCCDLLVKKVCCASGPGIPVPEGMPMEMRRLAVTEKVPVKEPEF